MAWATAPPPRGRADGTVTAAGRVRRSLEAASLWQEQDGFPRAFRKSPWVVVGFWWPGRGLLSRNHAWMGGAGGGCTELLPGGPACFSHTGGGEPRDGRFHSTGGLPTTAVLAHGGLAALGPPKGRRPEPSRCRRWKSKLRPWDRPAGCPARTHQVRRPCVPVWGACGQHRGHREAPRN